MKSLIADYLFDNSDKNQSKSIFLSLLDKISCTDYSAPHEFVAIVMKQYDIDHHGTADRSVHGRVFEFVIGEILAQSGIGPLYYQVELQHITLAKFDWLLYHPVNIVSISCKTKARDRWKQAAYEGVALKKVYPQATNYLITIEPLLKSDEKIREAPQALDYIIVATDSKFSDAVSEISKMSFEEAKATSPIVSGSKVSLSS